MVAVVACRCYCTATCLQGFRKTTINCRTVSDSVGNCKHNSATALSAEPMGRRVGERMGERAAGAESRSESWTEPSRAFDTNTWLTERSELHRRALDLSNKEQCSLHNHFIIQTISVFTQTPHVAAHNGHHAQMYKRKVYNIQKFFSR
jgi:hypothetical protein